MFERLRFAHYALRFERAVASDRWDAVRRCFDDDASYTMEGAPPFDGETRGGDAIILGFQKALNEIDRKFDRRVPGLVGAPRVHAGELTMRWRVRYVLGPRAIVLHGTTTCSFEHGRIIRLRDVMDPSECRAVAALIRS